MLYGCKEITGTLLWLVSYIICTVSGSSCGVFVTFVWSNLTTFTDTVYFSPFVTGFLSYTSVIHTQGGGSDVKNREKMGKLKLQRVVIS